MASIKKHQDFAAVQLGLVLTMLSVLLFFTEIIRHQPDIPLHSEIYLQPWGPEVYSHVLYFWLLAVFSGFSKNISVVNGAAIVLLTLFTLAKYAVLYFILNRYAGNLSIPPRSKALSAVMAFLLCIVHPIPIRKFPLMVGYLPANIWHNSTAIVAAPFCLLLAWQALQLMEEYSLKKAMWMVLLVILSELAKPNFFIVFAPAYLLLLFKDTAFHLNRRFWVSSIPIMAGLVILSMEYIVAYTHGTATGIGFSPFLVWRNITPIPWEYCLLCSLVFPLAYLSIYGKPALKDPFLVFAWLIVIFGILLFIFLYERGSRMLHGNFVWQVVPAIQLLFLSTLLNWQKHLSGIKTLFRPQNLVLLILFMLHVGAGCLYVYKIFSYDIW